MHGVRRPWRTHILVLLAYALLALALTWPLLARFGSHVPGDGADDPPLTWNLWWIRYSLLDLGQNPFDCDYLFYPIGINLAFYTLTLLNGLLSIPLQAVAGLVPASNTLLLSSFVLSGYGAFLLAQHVLGTYSKGSGAGSPAEDARPVSRRVLALAAFSAGALYAFSSTKLFYAALGQWNIASSQWIPFYVLALLRIGENPENLRHAFMAALFLLFQTYAELTYTTFLVLFTVTWLIWHLLDRRWRERSLAHRGFALLRPLVRSLILLCLLFALGSAILLAMMLPDMLVEGNVLLEGGGFSGEFSADLVGFAVPTMLHPLFGALVEFFSFPHQVGQHLYLGYSVLLLALLGAAGFRYQRQIRLWLASAGLFWLLTLGPTLRINGRDSGLPLPYQLVASLPFFEGNRYPSRYGVMLTLSLAILLAYGMVHLAGRAITPAGRSRRSAASRPPQVAFWLALLAVLPCGLFLFEHLSAPLPLSNMQVPPVYAAVTDWMPQGSTLLDIPVAWRNGARVTGIEDTLIMFEQYYQSAHRAPILAGNTSRNPPLKFQYFTEAPIINTLIALETGHPVDVAVLERDRTLAPEVLRFFSIGTIIVHPVQSGSDVRPYIERVMPANLQFQDDSAAAYLVDLQAWPHTWTAAPGTEIGRLSYVEGWGVPNQGIVWAQRRAVRLLVPADGQAQRLVLRAHTPEPGQRLSIGVNGHPAGQIELEPGWQDYDLVLPAEMVAEGLNELWLRFSTLHDARQARLAPRAIGSTGIVSPVNLVVKSAGYEVGDLARIYVNGRDVSPNERGYNAVIINPETGHVAEVDSFDTHADAESSRALAAFLGRAPVGWIVAVAAADEASAQLGQEAVEALRRIGSAGDLREHFRWGHAIIGVQGAAPGSALEAIDWIRPVTLVVGEGLSEPAAAAAFSSVVLSATSE